MNVAGRFQSEGNAPSSNMMLLANQSPSLTNNNTSLPKDLVNISPELNDKFNKTNSQINPTLPSCGLSDGCGMVPGFNGTTSTSGSMFDGLMEMMSESQQMMMMAFIKMMEEMQKQNGFGQENNQNAAQNVGDVTPSATNEGSPFGNIPISDGGGGTPSTGGGSGSPSTGGGGGSPSTGGSSGSPSTGGGGGTPSTGGSGGTPSTGGSGGTPSTSGNNSAVEESADSSNSEDLSGLSKEEIKKKIEENLNSQKTTQSQIEPAKSKKETLENEVKKLESDNTKIQGEIDKSKSQQTKVNGEISELGKKEQDCQEKLEAEKNKKDENGKPNGNPEKFEEELKKIKEEKTKKQEELKKEKETEQQKQKELNENKQKLNTKKSELEKSTKEVTELEKKLETLKTEQKRLEDQLKKLEESGEGKYSSEGRPHGLSEIKKQFGEPGKNQVTVEMPAGKDGKMIKVTCHKDIADRMKSAFQEVKDSGLSGEIKTFDGSYNNRNKRGGSSKSVHAWGIAFDVNAAENPMKKGQKPTAGQQKLANIFGKYGFYNLPGDPMHFQFATGY